MGNNRRSVTTIAAVAALVAGCGVGGGALTGTGGSYTPTAGRGGYSVIVPTGGSGTVTPGGAGGSSQQCGAPPQVVMPLSPEIEIVLDTSASMNESVDPACGAGCFGPSKWAASVAAINTVIDASPPGVRWGLSFIGGAPEACDLGRVGAVIGSGTVGAGLAFLTSGGALAAQGMRPTRAAIDRATTLLGLNVSSDPRIILLITDGMPNCNPSASDAKADDVAGSLTTVGNAFANGTSTFVVGLGIHDGPTDTTLSTMAIAGGFPRNASPAYYPTSSSGDLVAAMNVLVASTNCAFLLPLPPNSGTTSRENIAVSAGGLAIPQDANDGWAYSDATHTAIRLHGSSCALAQSDSQAVSITFRCPIP